MCVCKKKQDLELNKQQWLMYHKIQPNQLTLNI